MFDTKKITNVDQYVQNDGKAPIVFKAQAGNDTVHAEFQINTVGPCVARVQLPDEGKKPGKQYLLGTFEGRETIQFAIAAQQVAVFLEPSGEVWVRREKVFATADNPNPEENFTRMEKMGLEMDELGIALHRQAVLNAIESDRRQIVADSYTRRLERQLEETNAVVKKLADAEAARVTALATSEEALKAQAQ